MSKYGFRSLAFYLLIILIGCSFPSKDDIERLNRLSNKYGDRYSFKLEDEFYIKVKLRDVQKINEDEIKDIYEMFFFDEAKKEKRKTTFVYLNLFDSSNTFRYQLYMDYDSKKLVKSSRPYY